MITKLTLTMDKAVIERAKKYAEAHNRSVSKIVEQYLEQVANSERPFNLQTIYAPVTESLAGLFRDDGRPYEDLLDEARTERFLTAADGAFSNSGGYEDMRDDAASGRYMKGGYTSGLYVSSPSEAYIDGPSDKDR
jgi:hypothetical protein